MIPTWQEVALAWGRLLGRAAVFAVFSALVAVTIYLWMF